MRIVLQRVREAAVTVGERACASIGKGCVILLGVRQGDTAADAEYLAAKCAALRIFEDGQGKMNLDIRDAGGAAIVVSQFTLYADTRRGNRPSFSLAAGGAEAEPLYEHFVLHLRRVLGDDAVQTGEFGAMMDVHIVNDGPVTVIMESPARAGEGPPP